MEKGFLVVELALLWLINCLLLIDFDCIISWQRLAVLLRVAHVLYLG